LKKVLILTSHYLPNPTANGINTESIINELKKRRYNVYCVSLKRYGESSFEIINGTPIYRVSSTVYARLLNKEAASTKKTLVKNIMFKAAHLLRKLKLALLLFQFPNVDLYQAQKIYKVMRELHKKEKFDCVIGVFKPYSNIAAMIKFKNKHSNILCGAYYLDLINSSQRPAFMPQSMYKKLCYNGDINTFKKLDFVLMAKGGKLIYELPEYSCIRKKLEYIDFPTFLPTIATITRVFNKSSKAIILTYAGTLDRGYRNPECLLKVLLAVSRLIGNIELNIYGTGNCDDILIKYSKESNFKIIKHGMVSHDVVLRAMLNSDFLINISNKLQNAVPSKIFEMFSTGKPIINVLFDSNDITTEYFKKYPTVFMIEAWKSFDQQIKNLHEFMKSENGKSNDISFIKNSFIENTPEYTVDIIEKKILEFN
jgi:glycosyltransferase involved in cell wall biosynthesis